MSSLELLLAVFPPSTEVLRLHAVVGGQSTPDPDQNDNSFAKAFGFNVLT